MVELKQIIGTLSDGTVVENPIDQVFFGGQAVGLIAREPGANMSLTQWLSEADRKQLATGLAKARKAAGFDDSPQVQGDPLHADQIQAFLEGDGDEAE